MSTVERHSDDYLCLHCENATPMLIRSHQSMLLKESEDDQFQWLQIFDFLECLTCSKSTLRSYLWMEPDGDPEHMVFQRHYSPELEIPNEQPDWIKCAVELNANLRVDLTSKNNYSMSFIGLETEDTILIYVACAYNMTLVVRQCMNTHIETAWKVIAKRAESFGWISWLKVQERFH